MEPNVFMVPEYQSDVFTGVVTIMSNFWGMQEVPD